MQVRSTLIAVFAASASLTITAAYAQERWPTKPITYIVPYGAGGTTDVLARLVTTKAGQILNTTFVVENKAGAGGNIGTEYTARAAPDGYTIEGGTMSTHAINGSLYPKLSYDPIKSFQPVTMIGAMPNILVVRADSPYKTVQDVIAAAKAKPGAINFASSGNGTSQHLSGVLFEQKSGTKLVHVPYKSSAESLTALLSGQGADMIIENLAPALPHIKSGKLRALGVTSVKRAEALPDVPTIAESLPGFDVTTWHAVFAPAGTPKPVVAKLSDALIKAIADPEVKSKLMAQGVEPSGMTPEELAAFQKAEVEKWAHVIRTANIRIE